MQNGDPNGKTLAVVFCTGYQATPSGLLTHAVLTSGTYNKPYNDNKNPKE